MLTIIDSGVANVGSVANMLHRIGIAAQVSNNLDEIAGADRLILPGVGSFDQAMSSWTRSGLVDAVNKAVLERAVPCLGICLGMQVMARSSEEGVLPGLGWFDARVVRFRQESPATPLRVPHMGWNIVRPNRESPILEALGNEARFYFVPSYHIVCAAPEDVLAVCEYGGVFPCAIQRRNIVGVQFHPEKSHKFGMRLLDNFSRWNP